MSIIPILFFALVALLGFGLGGPTLTQEATPELSAPSTSAAASPISPTSVQLPPKVVRSMFEHREELPTCGTIAGNERGVAAWQCLQDASDQSGAGAELVRVGVTDEGDSITTYLRISHGQLEILTDNSQDSFRGDPAWTYDSCPIPDDVRSECIGS